MYLNKGFGVCWTLHDATRFHVSLDLRPIVIPAILEFSISLLQPGFALLACDLFRVCRCLVRIEMFRPPVTRPLQDRVQLPVERKEVTTHTVIKLLLGLIGTLPTDPLVQGYFLGRSANNIEMWQKYQATGMSGGAIWVDDFTMYSGEPVPEPSSLLAFGVFGVGALGFIRRRRA